jgi:RNA polymerase sigma-70 factor, ECF subfamily
MADELRRFEKIFLPHLESAFNLARWIVQQDQDAEDVVQEAYMRAFKGFHGFRGENGRAWFLKIVRNTAYTWINRHAGDEKLIPYEEEKHADIISINQSTSDMTVAHRKEYLQMALDRLPVEFREIIVLFEFEGMSYKELALALNLPIGTVMSRLSRARRRLQQEFGQYSSSEEAHGM